MRILRFFDEKVKYLRWFDISLIKLSSGAFILMVAKFYPVLLSLDWYWYLTISLLAAITALHETS